MLVILAFVEIFKKSENSHQGEVVDIKGDNNGIANSGNNNTITQNTIIKIDNDKNLALPKVISIHIEENIQSQSFNFSVDLSHNLPQGYKVCMNFDDLKGGWLSEFDDGGHIQLNCNKNICKLTKTIKRQGYRKVRVGIFKESSYIVEGSYSPYKGFRVKDDS